MSFMLPNFALSTKNIIVRRTYYRIFTPFGVISKFKNARIVSPRAKFVLLSGKFGRFHQVLGYESEMSLTRKQELELPIWMGPPKHISGISVMSNQICDPLNLYHFYLHLLLPFLFLRRQGIIDNRASLLFLTVPTEHLQHLMSLFKVAWTCGSNSVTCDDLFLIWIDDGITKSSIDSFRKKELGLLFRENDMQKNFSKIYIARRSRRPQNHEEIFAIVERFGYQTVYMEDHEVFQQMRIARAAQHVIADHGAGEVYLIYMDLLSLVEFIPLTHEGEEFGSACYQKLASMISPQTQYIKLLPIRSDDVAPVSVERDRFGVRQFSISPNELDKVLRTLHHRPIVGRTI